MVVTNTFAITYNGVTAGGSSATYQLLGPYTIERNYERIRLSYDVLVVATTQDQLRTLSEDLETALAERDAMFRITIAGTNWTFEPGVDVLNVVASIAKSGSPETDKSHSRSYTVNIEATTVETANEGLREISTVVNVDASGRSMVTFSGIYTAEDGVTASENYLDRADAVCAEWINTLRGGEDSYEMIDETFTPDRNNHICQWQRQYRQIVYNQSGGTIDDPRVKDHRVAFTDRWSQPGDSVEGVSRLRRVDASFDCAVVIAEGSPDDLWDSVVRQFLLDEFTAAFSPSEFAIEESSASFDRTASRLMATMRIVYRPSSGTTVVEVAQSLTYRESRTIDYTPIHSARETDMYADAGWATIERVWLRSVQSVGDDYPRRRLFVEPGGRISSTGAGPFSGQIAGVAGPDQGSGVRLVVKEGWNIVSSQSQVTEQYMGHPEYGQQFKVTTLNETVIERFNTAPQGGTTGGR